MSDPIKTTIICSVGELIFMPDWRSEIRRLATIEGTRVRRKRWNVAWDAEMIRDWGLPTSLTSFARRFGVSQRTVREHAIKLGLWQTTQAMKEAANGK